MLSIADPPCRTKTPWLGTLLSAPSGLDLAAATRGRA